MVKGKSVLDVGSGCGATSIAAIMRNAKYSVANDIDDGRCTYIYTFFRFFKFALFIRVHFIVTYMS